MLSEVGDGYESSLLSFIYDFLRSDMRVGRDERWVGCGMWDVGCGMLDGETAST